MSPITRAHTDRAPSAALPSSSWTSWFAAIAGSETRVGREHTADFAPKQMLVQRPS